ncbi:hypothetical protein HYDPIDRAFT_34700 [Hydnomerulius pinastri MD-312]|uniref:SLS1 N-terminal domain-containing protein n=1 Tax=Hydnomerulius pinastri MD-312 TaxID=994086 RepID=A0A0C9W5K4_9AGAM|nr:hypothetical protein HYDPIDRAFT_34700 [Hydnomerulius pinastri MD-312]
MSASLLRHCAARRSPCFSCLQSRRAKAYYSQPALAFSSTDSPRNPEISKHSSVEEQITVRRTRTKSRKEPEETNTSSRNPLEPTRVDRYLASIRAAGIEPTLEDVERCKPEQHSRPESLRYAEEYTELLDTLCRSFSKDQLRRFTELYKLDPIWTRSSRRKAEYAESIIEKVWHWPSLKEIERKRRDRTEILVKTFPVTPSQLFLVMGKDGADLLQLSMQYNVHISLTSDPLALRVEGLRGALKELTEHMSSLKKGIIDEIFELPTGRPIRPDLIQRISRLAGAYVESHGNRGKIRICAKDINNMRTAERLALRASLEGGAEAQTSTICYNPPSVKTDSPVPIAMPHNYSLYPFMTPNSFPWTMNTGGAFRVRRVTDWLGVSSYEDIAKTGGLANNSGRLSGPAEAQQDLHQIVFTPSHESPVGGRRLITASLGHLLLSADDSSQRTNILPPLKGNWVLPKILKWLQTSKTPVAFVPSIPPAVILTPPDKRRVLHRLIYRTLPQLAGEDSQLPQRVLKFEMEFLGGPSKESKAQASSVASQSSEDALFADQPSFGEDYMSEEMSPEPASPRNQISHTVSEPRCQIGKETFLNLMMPDRPMDLQLSIFDHEDAHEALQPAALREYTNKLRDFATSGSEAQSPQPDPPSTFNHDGREYYLHDSLTLRQSDDPLTILTVSDGDSSEVSVQVCNESIVDLESSQKMETCQVKFDGTSNNSEWKHFLSACDQLSAVSLQPQSKKDEVHVDYLEE